jgi:uncharacterized peroxidase-related enzyme
VTDFTFYDDDTAPEQARASFDKAKQETGRVANIYRYMAGSPQLLEGYQYLRDLFFKTSFTPVEQELVQLVISFEHGCKYCMAVHSMRAKMAKIAPQELDNIRAGRPVADNKLAALETFTRQMVLSRGNPNDAEIAAFLEAGYSRQNILEVVLAIGMKVLTNYANHLFEAPLDEPLKPLAWTKPD